MIRFWITTPDHIDEIGHTDADINNWHAVNQVMCNQPTNIQRFVVDVYRYSRDMSYRDAVSCCCLTRGWSAGDGWKVIVNVCREIARARGLI